MRHKVKIFASEVASLTDARYFSAIGAHWLGHFPEKTKLSDEAFFSIQSWIVGPTWVLEQYSEQGAEPLMKTLNIYDLKTGFSSPHPLKADFIELSLEEWLSMDLEVEMQPVHWVVDIKEMPSEMDLIRLKRSAGLHAILLKMPQLSPEQCIYLIQKCHPLGIVLCGGKEDKTGFKSYDRIDDIIDLMQDLDWI